MNKLKKKYLSHARILAVLLLILMILGSFLDLRISKALYPGHESTFGQVFAAFGKMPAFLFLICAGVLLYPCIGSFRRFWRFPATLASAALILGGVILATHEATDSVPALPGWVALLAVCFVSVLASGLMLLCVRQCSVKTLLRFVLTAVFVCAGTMAIAYVMKGPWGRARMRLIRLTGNESYFSPWWKPGSALKTRLTAEGVGADEFCSFPSGHAACAACAWLLILLPTLFRSLRGKERLMVVLGTVCYGFVAFSRIQMGAHFVTDVTFAALVALGMSVLGIYLFYFNRKVFKWIWNLLAPVGKTGRTDHTK